MTIGEGPYLPLIYSVFARNHGRGGLAAVTEDIERIAALGVDYVWLMPFHPVGEQARKGSLGSPYAIRDYAAVDPALGNRSDFVQLVDAAHRHGLGVMIDIVYNHVSPDSVIAASHPEWLLRDAEGSPGPRIADWSDVVDLDYAQRDLWDHQIHTMAGWLALGVDGFRCDVAQMVPMAFWMQARDELDPKYGHTLWLAESADAAFERELTQAGVPYSTEQYLFAAFDLCYDYGTYPGFRDLHAGKLSLSDYLAAKRERLSIPQADHGFAHFLENHDHDRAASYIDADLLPAWLALTVLSPGGAIIYAGQELGLTHTPSLFELDPIPLSAGADAAPVNDANSPRAGTLRATGPADLLTRLAALRHGVRREPVTIRTLGPAAVAIEWGSRRRSSVVLDLTGTLRVTDSWPRLPELIPSDATHIERQALAPGVSLVTWSLTTI